LPYFGPTWQATLNLNPDLNLKYDVPITLESVEQTDTYEGTFQERRAIIWTLNFTMKTWFFGPTYSANTGIIKNIDINSNIPSFGISIGDANANNTDAVVRLNIYPGQDANGVAINTSSPLYTYRLQNSTGTFNITEKVFETSNKANFVYVQSSNSTYMTAYNVNGDLDAGSIVIGSNSGFTANIQSVSVNPGPAVDWNTVTANSDWSFITDIIENF